MRFSDILCSLFFFVGNPEFLGGFPNCWDTQKKRPTIYQLHVTSCRIPLCKDSGGSCCPGEDVDRFSRKTISFFEDESFGASLGCVFLATWLEFAVFFLAGHEIWDMGSWLYKSSWQKLTVTWLYRDHWNPIPVSRAEILYIWCLTAERTSRNKKDFVFFALLCSWNICMLDLATSCTC